jgi:AcrR family transcriptional regulator
MGASVAAFEPPRRTQAERRAATRVALLDATIECLIEAGYANTTTRAVAARAGVTPGAVQHHFATKAELLAGTLRHIGKLLVLATGREAPDTGLPVAERTEQFLDRVWELFSGPLFEAGTELWVAARTDRELRGNLLPALRYGARSIIAAGPLVYPELAGRAGLVELIETGQAALRGLALLRLIDAEDADRVWPATRAHLLEQTVRFSAEAQEPR